jgi:TRAP-type mannitol/chloroaromatic compound transport system permease large subunit
VSTGDIYKGILPFVGIQVIGLTLLALFPVISLWLPTYIGWMK